MHSAKTSLKAVIDHTISPEPRLNRNERVIINEFEKKKKNLHKLVCSVYLPVRHLALNLGKIFKSARGILPI